MSASYCTGTFIGTRIIDSSISRGIIKQHSLKFTLSFTPTKRYPSAFGAGIHDDITDLTSSTIIHGTYQAATQEATLIEMIDGIATYEYQCKLVIIKTGGNMHLYGSWKSLTDPNMFGKLAMVSEPNDETASLSGIWTGEAQPAAELADFFIPVNPIRWCATLFRISDDTWQLFGSGYFHDSADIPNQPLLFFSLDGKGTLNDMQFIKKYATIEYVVEYRGQINKVEQNTYVFTGDWSNSQAGSYGSFQAELCQLNPILSYRLDICICEVCTNILNPGDNRWFCASCNFTVCPGCNLNDVAVAHSHKLIPHILPTQQRAYGTTSMEFISDALKVFKLSPFIGYRNQANGNLVWLTYGDVSPKCYALAKYWRQFFLNISLTDRPFIMFLADTSPAYIVSLLAGLLCQAVLVPTNGALSVDALTHLLSVANPSVIIVGEHYFDKFSSIPVSKSDRLIIRISKNEEQFQPETTILKDAITLTTALELGMKLHNDILPISPLPNDALSAILSTSGSTGIPKGAMFTEDLIVPKDTFTLISPFIRIDYQPFDPTLILSLMTTIQYGSSRGLTNLKEMWDDIRETKPTSLGLSPAIWTFLYKSYLKKLTGNTTNEQKERAAREMQESLGGRVVTGTAGGGSTSPSVLSFIRKVLKIDVVDMYGCRECGNIARNGVLYPGIDVKLIPVPELGLDGETEGEVCVHSPRMISGYWSMNKSPFIDIDGKRYYRTGDIGTLSERTLKLSDRSGNMIKNSMAEWISPSRIENILEQLPEISSTFVVGDSGSAYVAAIVCPSDIGKTMSESELLQLIRFYGAHCGLRGSEIPQRIYIERDIIWNETNGLMKEKKCRAALLKHYSQVKNELFSQENVQDNVKSSDLSTEFVSILETVLNRFLQGQVYGSNTFLEIGADSLAVARLCKIYHERNIPLVPSTVYNYQLDHLEEILLKKRVVYDEIVIDIDWKNEYQIPERIKDLIRSPSSSRKRDILVTGSTGFLGPLLVHEIVNKTDSNVLVYCIIRATNVEHAQKRLEQDLQKCERFSSIDWTRIRCIVGDVSKEKLGLMDNIYNELTQHIGLVYHNASVVNLQVPYKALKVSNVSGTLNCLEFVLKSNARLVYTSSTAALPALTNFKEDSNGWVTLTDDDINLKDGYGQSKVISEQLLYNASNLGADIVVVRPCTISADTQTGFSNVLDFINLLLLAEVEMGCMVDNANLELHSIPVDYCAKATVALAMHPDSRGHCFNFYGNGLSIRYLHDIVVQHLPGVIQTKIEQSKWKQHVLNNLPENSLAWRTREQIASMIFTTENLQNKKAGVRIGMTKDFLKKKCNLDWFEVTEQDLARSVQYLIKIGFLSRCSS